MGILQTSDIDIDNIIERKLIELLRLNNFHINAIASMDQLIYRRNN